MLCFLYVTCRRHPRYFQNAENTGCSLSGRRPCFPFISNSIEEKRERGRKRESRVTHVVRLTRVCFWKDGNEPLSRQNGCVRDFFFLVRSRKMGARKVSAVSGFIRIVVLEMFLHRRRQNNPAMDWIVSIAIYEDSVYCLCVNSVTYS